ncbi:MAG TPA: hypothetical protein ENK09_13275 [Nitrospirae bacterium]|nr:hypothetical protein [Nitrospirota bacterium]
MQSLQHIAFELGREEFSIPILQIQEIIKPVPVTRMPESPEYITGIINLRGKVIPVIDLKTRMSIPDNGSSEKDQRVIVVNTGTLTVGGIVDAITGVIEFTEEDIKKDISSISSGMVDYIDGIAMLSENRLVQLLNFKKILSVDDMQLLEDNILSEEFTEDGKVVVTKKVSSIGGEYIVQEVKDKILEQVQSKGHRPENIETIMKEIQNFLNALSEGDLKAAEASLLELSRLGDKELFSEVGKITRNLHNSLSEFKSLIDPRLKNMTLEDMPEAADKLKWVISKTEESANKTIGIMEKNLSLQSDIIKRLDLLDELIKNSSDANDEHRDAMAFLRNSLEEMNLDFMEVLLAQEYQDLTGQIIKKVISLVTELELQLVNLIKVFGVKVEGPEHQQTETEETVDMDTLDSQEDVDSLLKEFGF